MNPMISYARLSDYTLSMTETEDTSFPLNNLKTYYEDDLWKSSNNNNGQHIAVDFGSARSCDSLALAEENIRLMTGAGDVRLQGASNSSFTSPTTLIGDLVGGTPDADDGTRRLFTFAAASFRYWRILFVNTDATIPQIGQFFLGTHLEFETTYDWPYRKGNPSFETHVTKAIDGRIRASQAHAGRLATVVSFTLQNDATRTGFITFAQTVRGRLFPFYFVGHDSSIHYVVADSDDLDVEVTKYNLNAMRSLSMREQRATRV